MNTPSDLSQLSPDQLRHLAATLMSQVVQQEQTLAQSQKTLRHTEWVNQKLTYEMTLLKRHTFGKRNEQLNVLQVSLLEEVVNVDIAAIETEVEERNLTAATPAAKKTPRRAPLPPELLRIEIHHDPENDHCASGCQLRRIGEEVSEKLDYTPGVFHVERHVRGKWVCDQCETLTQEPMPAQIIDKGIPTADLLAQVLIAKYARSSPALSPGADLCPCRRGDSALDPGGVGRHLRRAAPATDRCPA